MTQRNGTTLTEVLVAIFIMAIGMMSLLTLFPVGALSMAQAIKDDRVTQAAINGAAIAEARGLRHDPKIDFWFTQMGVTDPASPYYPYSLAKYTNPAYDGPSYPIFIDPLGVSLNAGPLGKVGPTLGIPRTTPTYAPPGNTKAMYQWFSLLDDMTYVNPATSPAYGVPTLNPLIDPVQREGRYSWTYLLKRPRFRDSTLVDMTVIAYSARSQVVPVGEYPFYPVAFHSQTDLQFNPTLNINTVRLDYTAMGLPKPDMRKGHWILDATIQRPGPGNQQVPEPHGYFYRVVGITETQDDSGQPALLLELQIPAKASTDLDPSNPEKKRYGTLVFMEGVAEVFEKGTGWQP